MVVTRERDNKGRFVSSSNNPVAEDGENNTENADEQSNPEEIGAANGNPNENSADNNNGNNLLGEMRMLFERFEQTQNERSTALQYRFEQFEQLQENRMEMMRRELRTELNEKLENFESRLARNIGNDFGDFELFSNAVGKNNGNNRTHNNAQNFGNFSKSRTSEQFVGQTSGTQNNDSPNEIVGALRDMVLGMEKRTSELIKANECQQFAQISATIKDLAGNEGRTQLLNYFANLETITEGWNNQRRAQLLATHLIGQCRVIFDGLGAGERNDYIQIKNAILRSGGGNNALRYAAQSKLHSGLRPENKENLREYGLRILALTRDSLLSNVPDTAVEDLAKSYFLNSMPNQQIKNALSMVHDNMRFHQLIDKAEELRERANLSFPSQNWPSNNIRSQNWSSNNNQNFGSFAPQINSAEKSSGPEPQKSTGANSTPLGINRAKIGNNNWNSPQNGQKSFGKNVKFANTQMVFGNEENDKDGILQHVENLIEEPQNEDNDEQFLENDESEIYLGTNVISMDAKFPRNWEKRDFLVPLKIKSGVGLDYALIDSSGKAETIHIGKPKGPICLCKAKIFDQKMDILIDSGATINVISTGFLENLMEEREVNPHQPIFTKSTLANNNDMGFVAGITLPVEIGAKKYYCEFQITDETSFPIILGTASLSDLGFKLIDPVTGKDLLKNENSKPPKQNSHALVTCIGTQTIQPLGKRIIEIKSNVSDGEYLLEIAKLENMLITMVNGKAKIVVENKQIMPINWENDSIIGKIEEIKLENLCCGLGVEEKMESNNEQPERIKSIMNMLKMGKLNQSEKMQLEGLIKEFSTLFALDDTELGQTELVMHKIELVENKIVKLPIRSIPFAYREKVANMVQDYLNRGVIRPSNSPFSAPIVLVKKKDGTLRMCIDYRQLNNITRKDAYPIPNIDAMLLSLGNKKYFSSLDLLSGYWQIKMDPKSIEKTAFNAMNGHYEFVVMPFGLTNAPATFERFMERILDGIIGDFVFVYLDDILIASESWEEHLMHLKEVLKRIEKSGLKLKPSKCELIAEEIDFLGHTLTREGLKMNTKKVESIKKFPIPAKLKELQSFLGLAGYYRKFIKDFALIAKPLYGMLKKNNSFSWNEECQKSFKILIEKIADDVTLCFPDFKAAMEDEKRAFIIQTDASKLGIAGILGQLDGKGKSRPIYFVSRICKDAETRYGISELEALALKFAVKKFAPFIIGIKTIIETDHSPLVQMFSNPKDCGSPRVNRWAMEIMSKFDLIIKYKPGKSNVNADALSRAFADENSKTILNTIENNKPGIDQFECLGHNSKIPVDQLAKMESFCLANIDGNIAEKKDEWRIAQQMIFA